MAKAKPTRIPEHGDMRNLMHAALAHAQKRLASAELLLASRDWSGAHAMATLAFEEVGKSVLCMIGMAIPERERVNDWFKPAFNDHRTKITIARFTLAIFTAFLSAEATPSQPFVQAIEQLFRLAGADHQKRLRADYVDFRDGDVLEPSDVSEADAEGMIGNVRACLEVLTHFNTDPEAAAAIESFMVTMSTWIEGLLDSTDVDGLSVLQGMWDGVHAGGPPKPPWELVPGLAPAPGFADDTAPPAGPAEIGNQ
jgi:AbiV family abortive infection protein